MRPLQLLALVACFAHALGVASPLRDALRGLAKASAAHGREAADEEAERLFQQELQAAGQSEPTKGRDAHSLLARVQQVQKQPGQDTTEEEDEDTHRSPPVIETDSKPAEPSSEDLARWEATGPATAAVEVARPPPVVPPAESALAVQPAAEVPSEEQTAPETEERGTGTPMVQPVAKPAGPVSDHTCLLSSWTEWSDCRKMHDGMKVWFSLRTRTVISGRFDKDGVPCPVSQPGGLLEQRACQRSGGGWSAPSDLPA